ncbi:unnamed protein product [Paramecium sonneborni]|uniref:Uncharacterized protein n=1 Tax=Paramecium sonneborni TaxID=65129 RepID=A0A8S1NF41_9CILI|nr:unnamed protein product [Paramecium sonneborni]
MNKVQSITQPNFYQFSNAFFKTIFKEADVKIIQNLQNILMDISTKRKIIFQVSEVIQQIQKSTQKGGKLQRINKLCQRNIRQTNNNKNSINKYIEYFQIQYNIKRYQHFQILINIQVVKGAIQVVAETANSGYYFCFGEQAILKTGKIVYFLNALRILFKVGIGFREIIIQKYEYQNCYSTGTLLIEHLSYAYSHHNKEVHEKQLSFRLTINDIIIIEVCIEHKYIKWSRQNNPQLTFVLLDVDTSQELYPCMYGGCYYSKIKLLDNKAV